MNSTVPDGWSQKTLGDLAKVKRGASPRPIKDPKWWGGKVGWTRISDVTSSNKYLTATKNYLSDEGVEKSVQIPQGEVILSICATIGRPIIVKTDVCIHDGFVWFDGLNKGVSREFYYYFLSSKQEELAASKQTGTQGNLNTDIVSRLSIILPPLPEQKKIASILTSVDEVIENTQKQIDKLQDLKKATMNELLTKGIGHTEFKDSELGQIPKSWDLIAFGEVMHKIEGGGTPSRGNESFWGNQIPWATVKDLKEVRLGKTEESITEKGLKFSSSRKIPPNTVIIATRMALGKAVVFDKEVSINQDLKALFPKPNLDSEYLLQWYLYSSESIAALGTGSTVKGIRLEVIKAIYFLLPSLTEQKEIVVVLKSMDEMIEIEKEKRVQTKSLKKSLMQDLLTGKVQVTVN